MSAHYVRHWTRGGPTDLSNLVELCRFHHRLVHEGGWCVAFEGGAVRFESPEGLLVEDHDGPRTGGGSAEPPASTAAALAATNAHRGVEISAQTIVPHWCGDRLDLDLAITALTPHGSAEPLHPT